MNILPHPATLKLLRLQAAGRFSQVVRRFRQPRRLVLSILAVLLGIAWVGQAGLAILFREPTDPEKLRVWIPLGLLAYAIWHLMKVACRGPIEPFEWTPAEQEILGGAPLRRRDLVLYRLTSIGTASAAKAACFSLVMLPDLHVWLAGFIGMLLALLFVDLLRMSFEIFAYGLTRRAFMYFRVATLGIAGTAITSALISTLCSSTLSTVNGRPDAMDLGMRILESLAALRTTWVGVVLELPFEAFASVILASSVSFALIGFLLLTTILVLVTVQAVIWLDHHFLVRRITEERRQYQLLESCSASDKKSIPGGIKSMRVPKRLCGAGGLAWRQTLGAFHHRTSILISLTVPAILCCLTLLRPQAELATLMQVVGGLVFYSLLLLPTALKFDFRRDLDRLSALKALPISPVAATMGQLAAPVILAMLFQIVVLTVTMIARPFHPAWYIAAVIALVPVNVFIFALENLIFILYPYRPSQEGVGVFLRSILAFTAKGILFTIALVLTVAWGFASKYVSVHAVPGNAKTTMGVIFTAGIWLLCTASAVAATTLLIRVYRGFDPSEDTPALS